MKLGPVYYCEFNEENVESFSKITTVKLNNKFLNIYGKSLNILKNIEVLCHFQTSSFILLGYET